MNTKITVSALFLLITSFSYLSYADEHQTSIDCSITQPYTGEIFSDLFEETKKTAITFCNELIRSRIDRINTDDAYIGSILADFAVSSELALDKYEMSKSADYRKQFSELKNTFVRFHFLDIKMPEFKVEPSFTMPMTGYFEPLLEERDRFAIEEVEHCTAVAQGLTCKEIFREFKSAFNPYRSAYDNVYDNTKLLSALGERWDSFLEVSKSQTALEVYLTTLANKDHFKKNHLVGPPNFQIIAIHPHLIFNSMEEAPDGSKQELGLAVEWIGINYWDLKLPLGISFTTAYVDRENVKDVGHGIMLHIDNQYAIGWADHDGEDSFYVTFDLLKALEDKKGKYDKYMKHIF